MDTTPSHKVPPDDWIARCIQQIRLIEPDLSEQEAKDVARQLLRFERTGAMLPEDAVEFVVSELAEPAPRFERRSQSRLSTTVRR